MSMMVYSDYDATDYRLSQQGFESAAHSKGSSHERHCNKKRSSFSFRLQLQHSELTWRCLAVFESEKHTERVLKTKNQI